MPSPHEPFVRAAVQTLPNTERIIHKIQPHMPPGTTVIGGYLNSEQQVFKLNYHWELLIHNIDRCLNLNILRSTRQRLLAVRAGLMRNPPPARGYIKSASVNNLPDHSPPSQIMARWRVVKQSKKDFSWIVDHANLLQLSPHLSEQVKLIRSPILPPGRSHHNTGYALDLAGNKAAIARCCWSLGATLVFEEESHIHAEFGHGVLAEPDPKRHSLTQH